MSYEYENNKIIYVLVNIIVLVIVAVVFFLMYFEVIAANKDGFFCNDPKISYEHTGDTITNLMASLISVFVPLILIFLIETYVYFVNLNVKKSKKENMKMISRRFYMWFSEYIIALVINVMLVYIFKNTFGEPRPDFIKTCDPTGCENVTTIKYVAEYECRNKESSSETANRSYLSGHAATSTHAGVFMFIYIQIQLYHNVPRFSALFLQILSLAFPIVCSISRITDHRHHWWDVLSGFILGIITAVYAIQMYRTNYKRRQKKLNDEPALEDGIRMK